MMCAMDDTSLMLRLMVTRTVFFISHLLQKKKIIHLLKSYKYFYCIDCGNNNPIITTYMCICNWCVIHLLSNDSNR